MASLSSFSSKNWTRSGSSEFFGKLRNCVTTSNSNKNKNNNNRDREQNQHKSSTRRIRNNRRRRIERDVTKACGIIGVMTQENNRVSAELYEGLLMLQHRGQDSAGMVTSDGSRFKEKKDNGLVKDVFDKRTMEYLDGNVGIAHVRYPTQGGLSATEAQPFFVNSPLGIYLIHNGNLTNTDQLRLRHLNARHMRTNSDSEVLLNVFAEDLQREINLHPLRDPHVQMFDACATTMTKLDDFSLLCSAGRIGCA